MKGREMERNYSGTDCNRSAFGCELSEAKSAPAGEETMRKGYSIIAFAFIIILSSCGDKEVKFYKQHSDNLEKLAEIIASDATITDACCIKDGCFNPQALELMKKVDLECLRKDTIDGTINFILGSQGKKLESIEIIYLYNREFGEPIEFPKAGISIKKIKANWFVRRFGFD